jgi:hypothetical protein
MIHVYEKKIHGSPFQVCLRSNENSIKSGPATTPRELVWQSFCMVVQASSLPQTGLAVLLGNLCYFKMAVEADPRVRHFPGGAWERGKSTATYPEAKSGAPKVQANSSHGRSPWTASDTIENSTLKGSPSRESPLLDWATLSGSETDSPKTHVGCPHCYCWTAPTGLQQRLRILTVFGEIEYQGFVRLLTEKRGAGKSLYHEKDQESLVWCHLDRDLDGRTDLVFALRHVQQDGEYRIGPRLGNPRGSHSLHALAAFQGLQRPPRCPGSSSTRSTFIKCSLSVRFGKEIQALLREMNETPTSLILSS